MEPSSDHSIKAKDKRILAKYVEHVLVLVEILDCSSTGNSLSMISVPEEAEAMETDDEARVLVENIDGRLYEPCNIQLSYVPPLEDVKVTQVEDFDSRITISGSVDYALACTAIHDAFCVLEKNRDEDFIAGVIREYGLSVANTIKETAPRLMGEAQHD